MTPSAPDASQIKPSWLTTLKVYLEPPTLHAFKLAVGRLASREDSVRQVVIASAQKMIATQKTVHRAEQEALRRRLHRSALRKGPRTARSCLRPRGWLAGAGGAVETGALAGAALAVAHGQYNNAANRAYYAAFQAASDGGGADAESCRGIGRGRGRAQRNRLGAIARTRRETLPSGMMGASMMPTG